MDLSVIFKKKIYKNIWEYLFIWNFDFVYIVNLESYGKEIIGMHGV